MSVALQTNELDCWQSFIFLLEEIYIYNMAGKLWQQYYMQVVKRKWSSLKSNMNEEIYNIQFPFVC